MVVLEKIIYEKIKQLEKEHENNILSSNFVAADFNKYAIDKLKEIIEQYNNGD